MEIHVTTPAVRFFALHRPQVMPPYVYCPPTRLLCAAYDPVLSMMQENVYVPDDGSLIRFTEVRFTCLI